MHMIFGELLSHSAHAQTPLYIELIISGNVNDLPFESVKYSNVALTIVYIPTYNITMFLSYIIVIYSTKKNFTNLFKTF